MSIPPEKVMKIFETISREVVETSGGMVRGRGCAGRLGRYELG